MIRFPSNFYWGAATSSYQVEGNNANADWWHWEKAAGKEHSGQACEHYARYEADFDLAKHLHHNMHRLSIEWSRIEPRPGQFDEKEIHHYIHVIQALRRRGIEPMVTLHHFTNPQWLSEQGGWTNTKVIDYFLRYSDRMVRALGNQVRFWVTINEPTIYISHSFLFGLWPPQAKSMLKTKAAHDVMLQAHIRAYRLIHQIYRDNHWASPVVGISHHMPAVVTCNNRWMNKVGKALRDWAFNFDMLDTLQKHKAMDFIGLNYYSRQRVDVTSWWIGNLFGQNCTQNHDPMKTNSLGWDIYPQGLYQVLMQIKKYNLPVIITENGICTTDDHQRWDFIVAHLKSMHQAMRQGVLIQGYLYWSLLDNFEWDKGYAPRFGLIEMNYKTQERIVRNSAKKFAQVCQTGEL